MTRTGGAHQVAREAVATLEKIPSGRARPPTAYFP